MFFKHANDTPNKIGNALLHINCGRHCNLNVGLLDFQSRGPADLPGSLHSLIVPFSTLE